MNDKPDIIIELDGSDKIVAVRVMGSARVGVFSYHRNRYGVFEANEQFDHASMGNIVGYLTKPIEQ